MPGLFDLIGSGRHAPGLLGNLETSPANPLVMLGLGLAGGQNWGDGFRNAMLGLNAADHNARQDRVFFPTTVRPMRLPAAGAAPAPSAAARVPAASLAPAPPTAPAGPTPAAVGMAGTEPDPTRAAPIPVLAAGMKRLANVLPAGQADALAHGVRARPPLRNALEAWSRYADAATQNATPRTTASLVIATRNLMNNLRDAGIELGPEDLARAVTS